MRWFTEGEGIQKGTVERGARARKSRHNAFISWRCSLSEKVFHCDSVRLHRRSRDLWHRGVMLGRISWYAWSVESPVSCGPPYYSCRFLVHVLLLHASNTGSCSEVYCSVEYGVCIRGSGEYVVWYTYRCIIHIMYIAYMQYIRWYTNVTPVGIYRYTENHVPLLNSHYLLKRFVS